MIRRATILAGFVALLAAGALRAAAPEAIHGYVVVPLLNRGNQFFMEAKVNGHPVTLLLDTGMPVTTVLARDAARLNFSLARARGTSEIDSFVIGGVELRGASVLTLEFDTKSGAEKSWEKNQCAGLLGWDALLRWDAIVDVGHARLFLHTDKAVKSDVGKALVAAGWTEVPFTMRGANPTVPITIGGRGSHAIIDTGATYSTFDEESIRAAGIPSLGPRLPMNGIYQLHVKSSAAKIPDLVVGGFHGGSLPVAVVNFREAFQHDVGNLDALLGFDFLTLHAAVIDCRKQRLYLRNPR